jgi:hypothetical protein
MTKNIPGPGAYYPNDYTNGTYHLSTYKTVTTRKYRPDTNVIKHRKQMSETPGPGTYRLPSDFGYLELKKFVNTDVPTGRNYRNTN